jgi:hypothetical protein
MALTAARANLSYLDSGDFYDAFRFGTVGDTSWSFTNKTFHMDIKGSADDDSALLTLTSGNGRIVVDDAATRVLHLYVSQADWEAALVPGCYVYDLVMIDGDTTVRTPLMYGSIEDTRGVTQS